MISVLFVITAIFGFMFLNAVKNSVKPIIFIILMITLISQYRSEARYVLDKAGEAGDAVAPHVKNVVRLGTKSLNELMKTGAGNSDENLDPDKGSALAQEILGLK